MLMDKEGYISMLV